MAKNNKSNNNNNNNNYSVKRSTKNVEKVKVKGVVWNLDHIVNGMKYEDFLKKIESNVKTLESYRGKLDNISPSELLKLVENVENTSIFFSRVESFYSLKNSENTKDEEALAKLSAIEMFSSKMSERTLFFELWFMALDDKIASKYINSQELSKYKHFLEMIRNQKPYMRSEEVEKVLTIKDVTGGASFASAYDLITSSFKFNLGKEKGLGQDEVVAKWSSSDPKIRKKAYSVLLSKFNEEGVILSELYKDVVLDWYNETVRIRGHKEPISARNLSNDIDDASVVTMLRVVRKNSNIFPEYYKLKHKFLNKKGQKFSNSRFHIYAPLELNTRKYSFEDSKNITLNLFKGFDKDFYAVVKSIFDAGHVHSHPVPGKKSGAFCASIDPETLPYILLNHADTLMSAETMVHEFGHGAHAVFASKQPMVLSHASIPLCETASVFSEVMFMHKMLESAKGEEKISLLIKDFDGYFKSVLRQSYFVIFEKWAHDNIKEGVTRDDMNNYYKSLLVEQFGDMKDLDAFKHEWSYVPHIYHTPFYCYGYTWGNLLSLSFYAMYKEQGKEFVDKYKKFLSAGSSKSTRDIMLDMGVDPRSEEFWQKGFNIIKEDLNELKRLVK